MQETNNILAILDNYLHDNPDEIAKEMANDFRRRRIEKNLTREQVADKSGVAVSNITRFEQRASSPQESDRYRHSFGIHLRNQERLLATQVLHHGGVATDKKKR